MKRFLGNEDCVTENGSVIDVCNLESIASKKEEPVECSKSDVLPVHSTATKPPNNFIANTLENKSAQSTSNTGIDSSMSKPSSPQEHVEVDSIRVDSLSLKVSDSSRNKIENSSEPLESGNLNSCCDGEKAYFLPDKVDPTEHHLPTHTISHKTQNQKMKSSAHMITPVHTPTLHDMNKTQSHSADEPTSKKQKRNNKKSCLSQKGQNSTHNRDFQHARIQLPLKPTQHAKQGQTRPSVAQQHTLRALISAKEAGKVIGKAGAQISAIRKESYARVLVSDNEKTLDRIVTATGTLDSVAKAFALIVTSILSESADIAVTQDRNQLQISLGLLIPNNKMGCIIGKGGSKIKFIQEQSGANIHASQEVLPGSTERIVTLTGVIDAIHIAVYHVGQLLSTAIEEKQSFNIPFLPTNVSSGNSLGVDISGSGQNQFVPSHLSSGHSSYLPGQSHSTSYLAGHLPGSYSTFYPEQGSYYTFSLSNSNEMYTHRYSTPLEPPPQLPLESGSQLPPESGSLLPLQLSLESGSPLNSGLLPFQYPLQSSLQYTLAGPVLSRKHGEQRPSALYPHKLETGLLTERLLIPASQAGFLIGKNGENIKKIRSESGANVIIQGVSVDNKNVREVDIIGSFGANQIALMMIQNYLKRFI